MNEIFHVLLLLEVSDILNILLIIMTLGTVRYASKTLLMEYSSQIIISRYRMTLNERGKKLYTWEVDVENKGKGHVIKGFILLTVKSSKRRILKEFHLSKPLFNIEPGEIDVIKLKLTESELDGFDVYHHHVKLEVYYQDALNNIYVVSPGADKTHKHLEKFEKLPRKIIFLSPRFFKYKYKFNRAVQQANTFVERQKINVDNDNE